VVKILLIVLIISSCSTISNFYEKTFTEPKEIYLVKKGENLYSISRKLNIDIFNLIEINNLKSPYKIFPNQLLKLPDYKNQDPSSIIKFVNKPVNLNTYKEEARNWITFYASEGTTVFSADAGEVIISGPDIPGYGNMIIIKHPKGILSVYAHLNKSLVSKGDTVTSNQPIASVGKSESSVSMLKFQLRKGDSSISTKDYKFL
jgi:lipoprotein NlpD|tara:strand:- start:1755 stop:2363 length:609 start_codon:yes stop_codon:yes gene_type:complete